MPQLYFYCTLGKHMWPIWDRSSRTDGFISRKQCRECMSKIRTPHGHVGKSCESNPVKSAVGDEWVNSKKYAELIEKRERKMRRDELELDRQAAEKAHEEGRPYVTLSQSKRMWEDTAK
jgi:hypothetical protein